LNLYLVRHAIAEPRGAGDDSLRELTPEGIARLRAAAAGLARLDVQVEAVLSSPYPRAWQTAEVLGEELDWPTPEALDALAAPVSARECLDAVRGRREASLALVGHQPNLSELASLLLTGDEGSVRIDLRKAGIACLEAPGGPAAGTAVLRWVATPRMLRRLGR
jgi:phosphohistidine phosphatase